MSEIEPVTPDPWGKLREHTPARIALGRSGASLPTDELLRFGFAHAQARDAVHVPLDAAALAGGLREDGWPVVRVHSAAPDRATYLLRPDLGRRLGDASKQSLADEPGEDCDLLLVIGDGLSSLAVSRHARPLVAAIRAQVDATWRLGPIVVAEQARVALGDPIGAAFKAGLIAMLIGERPGLSSPDSLGIYLTWAPKPGRSDAERNCISNVRPEGLGYAEAANRLVWLAGEARRRGLTGVALKDASDLPRLDAADASAVAPPA